MKKAGTETPNGAQLHKVFQAIGYSQKKVSDTHIRSKTKWKICCKLPVSLNLQKRSKAASINLRLLKKFYGNTRTEGERGSKPPYTLAIKPPILMMLVFVDGCVHSLSVGTKMYHYTAIPVIKRINKLPEILIDKTCIIAVESSSLDSLWKIRYIKAVIFTTVLERLGIKKYYYYCHKCFLYLTSLHIYKMYVYMYISRSDHTDTHPKTKTKTKTNKKTDTFVIHTHRLQQKISKEQKEMSPEIIIEREFHMFCQVFHQLHIFFYALGF